MSELLTPIFQQLILFLPKLAAALTIFFLGIYLTNLVTRFLVRSLTRRNVNSGLTQFISSYVRTALIILIIFTALLQVDFDLTAFLAGLGIVGFTIGFALQDITQNIVAGLILLVQQPFELEDLVEIDGFTGYVREINIRTTRIHTLDGRDILIPNYSVISHPIVNYTEDPEIRICVQVNVGHDNDLDHVRRVTATAINNIPYVRNNPPIEILFSSFEDSAIKLDALFWINVINIPERVAINDGIQAIRVAFRRENISIPFPIQVAYEIKSDTEPTN